MSRSGLRRLELVPARSGENRRLSPADWGLVASLWIQEGNKMLYLDQRNNRQVLQILCQWAFRSQLFAYTGVGVSALRGGARRTDVESSSMHALDPQRGIMSLPKSAHLQGMF